jgi:uncharacterized repeat protein (TIGR02543 family)
MKRLSLFFAALFVAVAMFADITGNVAGLLSGGTPQLSNGLASASNRGGFIVKNDGVFFCNGATGFMGKMDLGLTTYSVESDSIGKGFYMDIDDGGNIIIYEWTVGSATLDVAQVYNANYQLIRVDSLGLVGRCDMPTCAGNLVTGRGAYFTAANSATKVLRYNYVDGVRTTVDTITVPVAMGGNSSVAPVDVDHFYVQSRGNALMYIDCSGAEPVVTNMTYFGVSTFTSAYGGKAFDLGGHRLYVMGTYKDGGYLGTFGVFDVTDPANPYQIVAEHSKMGTAAMGTACVTFRVVVHGDTAHIYEYACYAVRKYDLVLTPALYMKQGNEGAEWAWMDATPEGYTRQGIYMADSLYVNNLPADAGATKILRSAMNITGNVAVNDTVVFNYNRTQQVMGVELVGKFVPKLTFNVKVPATTPACFIAGTFNEWSFERMRQLTDSTYTITITGAAVANPASVEYKYTCGTDWAYVEKGAQGEEISNRHWAENDVVLTWASVPSTNVVTYELNGGVFNDFGWTSKGAVALELQNDYNTAYNTSKEWAKLEDGIYYYKIGENWMPEDQTAGQLCTVAGFIQNVTYNTTENLKTLIMTTMANKYGWLKDVIAHTRDAAGLAATDADLSENIFRKEVSGIMLESPADEAWPAAPSYAVAGTEAAILPIWKHAFCNPATVAHEFILNDPYKEGYTFDGWYLTSDFSGNKVLSINDSTPTCTLYAKWVEYVPTIAEAKAAPQNDTVKVGGIVTFVRGTKNVYIQDATGGLLVYTKSNATCKVGDYIVARGKNTLYGGAPEIGGATYEVRDSNQVLPAELTVSLANLVADTLLKNFGKRVYVEGLVVASYDANGNLFVTDGTDTVQCYYVTPDQSTFPVGTRVNLHLIAAWFNKFQFVGPVEGVELAPLSGKDPYVYPARGNNGEYTLTNKWLICDKLDNYSANRPAAANMCRGMAAKDGIMYFINRGDGSFTRVNGATGEMLEPLMITGEHLFQYPDSTGDYKDCVTLKFNDVKFDNAGNCLITACASGGQRVMVYKVDITTGAATELINERILDNPDFAEDSWRVDAIGVYGDVTGHAIVMFGNSMNKDLHAAYKWEINNGVAAPAERIDLVVNPEDNTYLWNADGELTVENNSACQVFPVDENYFYWDHHSCRPTLFTMDGTFADDLKSCPTTVIVANNPGDTCKVGAGHNGICEFQIGEEYFVIMAATNNVETPAGSFAIFKFADAAKEFSGLEPLWYLPAGGMGVQQNAYRTAVPTVEVNEDKATIYLYTGENGYGVYEMTGIYTGLKNVNGNDAKVQKTLENGQVYIIKNGVRYTVLGVEVK